MSNEARMQRMREILEQTFAPEQLAIQDDSHHHAGHASAQGGGHFTVRIVSASFADKTPVQCHRMVFAALKSMMAEDIHALSIQASAPGKA